MPALLNPFDQSKPRFARADLVGYVINVVDPDKRQRVKIRVPQLHRGVSDDDLPWAIPDTTQGRANAGGGAGSVNVPVRGSKVYVRFDDSDPHNPRYSGSPATDDVNQGNELLNEDYPHTRGSIDDAGNRQAVNSEKETIDIVHKSGATIHIAANGTVSISCANEHNLGAPGKIKLSSNTKIELKAPEIEFNSGADAATPSARQRPNINSQAGKTGY